MTNGSDEAAPFEESRSQSAAPITGASIDPTRLHAALAGVSDAIIGCDALGRIVFVGGASVALLGYDPESLTNQHFSAFVEPSELDRVAASIARWHERRGMPVGADVAIRCADGRFRRFHYVTRFGDGLFGDGSFLVTLIPDAESGRASFPSPAPVESEERISRIAATFLDSDPDGFAAALDAAVRELSGMPVVTRITVWVGREGRLDRTAWWDASADAPIGPPPRELFVDALPMARDLLAGKEVRLRLPDEIDPAYVMERKMFDASGSLSVLAVPLRAGGTVLGFVVLESTLHHVGFAATHVATVRAASSIIAAAMLRGAAQEELLERSRSDPITGFSNRWAARTDLQEMLDALDVDADIDADADADAGADMASGIGVVEIDLERFRLVNEALGHQAGDELLHEVASRLARSVPERARLARLSADEFLVLIPDVEDEATLLASTRKLLEVFDVPFPIGDSATSMRARAGALFLSPGESPKPNATEVLRRIDNIVDRAKQTGATIGTADPAQDTQLRRLRRIAEIEHALDLGELVPYFQAEWELPSGRVIGAEALLRWLHPSEGVVGADEVIPLAESAGLIDRIGRHVLVEACRTALGWVADHEGFVLRVNVSARQLRSSDFAADIADILEETGFPARSLCIELTESTLLDEPGASRRQFARLRKLGVGLAIDDFGTGYSSILQLKELPLSSIKIDQRFVAGVAEDPSDRAIVEATLELARAFGVTATAEGVETDAQRRTLAELGCTRVQGFLFSRPEPATEFAARLVPAGSSSSEGGGR
ncbi:MAG: GGDEF domain-containing protein [Actinobacteria bacterium]|nr:GGDEF domain-containing protein [Actinomycetota bacterium]